MIGKQQNQLRIFQLLQEEKELTRQDIAQSLQLSMPTALQNINEMIENGILEEQGSLASTGGRKARRIGFHRGCGYAIGIDIGLHQTNMVLTDILGNILKKKHISIVFQDESEWYHILHDGTEQFLQQYEVPPEKLLCTGISFPGIVDAEQKQIVRSHIFQVEHIGLERFERSFSCPVLVVNDANCACFAERESGRRDYVYLSLNATVGGALMIENQLMQGKDYQAGEIGHMILFPSGKHCYCGKSGCADAYLSTEALTDSAYSVQHFFHLEQNKNEQVQQRWEQYLEHLAILLTNLRMMMDTDIVIGGEIGTYMQPYMKRLCQKAEKYDLFARDIDYLYPCSCTDSAFAVGAALLALKKYSSRLLEKTE